MIDFRPVGYVFGLLIAALGAAMLLPFAVDLWVGSEDWSVFLVASVLTCFVGVVTSLATRGSGDGLSIQQIFLLTTGLWLVLPIFGAIPFIIGATEARVVDAFFEAMSGLTTTGSTVLTGLEELPSGILVWRSMLQWFGGVGIVVVAMVFLPELRVGGMQIFRSESFDTGGKVLPRAAQIAARITVVYVVLTVLCYLAYLVVGMNTFQAFNHALTTLSTGGFSTSDASFGAYQGPAEYVASVFMVLASLPFVRYVQILAGQNNALFRDSQVQVFLTTIFVLVILLAVYRVIANDDHLEHAIREGVFNVTSIMTGTGFASVDYQLWGAFPVVVFFFLGLVGGCAGSTCCSVKIFRYQLLFASIRVQIKRIYAPNGVFTPRYQGQSVSDEVIASVMAFFLLFVLSLGVLSVLLVMTGLDFVTAVSGAATALANVGPGLGEIIGPAGNFSSLNDAAKWLLAAAMLIGRLEVLSVYVMLTARFWRD